MVPPRAVPRPGSSPQAYGERTPPPFPVGPADVLGSTRRSLLPCRHTALEIHRDQNSQAAVVRCCPLSVTFRLETLLEVPKVLSCQHFTLSSPVGSEESDLDGHLSSSRETAPRIESI